MRTAADIRRANAFDVIRSLHAAGVTGRRQLAERTGLSFQTVATICGELLETGLVSEVSRTKAATGRPTAQLALNPEHGRLLGIDLAETYVHVETRTSALELISSTELEIDLHRHSPRQIVARVREAIEAEATADDPRPFLGVGVSAPGQVDRAGGVSVFAPNWNWRNIPLLEMLQGAIDAPLHLDNPLKALVLAELWAHPELGSQDFVVVNLGTGVGIGVALEGRLLRGCTNSAGEWGHTVVVAGGRQCRCGSRGCIETYVGAQGILQTLREVAPESTLLRGDDQAATIHALRDACAAGDAVAVEALERTAYYLGIGLAGIVNMLNPEVVILSSWVARDLGEQLLERARPHMAAHALTTPLLAASFRVDTSPDDSVSMGAAAFALEGYLHSLSNATTDDSVPALRTGTSL